MKCLASLLTHRPPHDYTYTCSAGEGRCTRGRKETLEEQTATKQLLDSASLQPVIYCRVGWELSMVSANWVNLLLSSSALPLSLSRLRI